MKSHDCSIYIRLNLEALLSDKRMLSLIVLLAFAFCLPLAISVPTGADYLYGKEAVKNQRDFLYSQIASGIYGNAPQDLQQIINSELQCLDRALQSPPNSSEYYREIADYDKLSLEEYRLGYLNGIDSEESLKATERLPRLISNISAPESYGSTSKMPGLYLIAYYCGAIPGAIWLIIPIVIQLVLLDGNGKRFSERGPLSFTHIQLCRICITGLAASTVLLLALTPCFIATSVFNGIGQADYPVVFIQYGTTVERTTASQCLLFIAFEVVISTVLGSLGTCIFSLSNSRFVSAIGMGLAGGMALVPFYSSSDAPWSPLLPYLFPSYCMPAAALGGASYANGADVAIAQTGTPVLCITVIAATLCIGLLGTAVLSRTTHQKRWSWSRGRSGISSDTNTLDVALASVSIGNTRLFENASLRIPAGQIWGLVAPNGYGKTTLLNLLWGQSNSRIHVSGSLSLAGVLCTDCKDMRSSFFLVPNSTELLFPHRSVSFHLRWCSKLWHASCDLDDTLKRFDLTAQRDKPVSVLSDGNKQLLNIALASIARCDVLLLDEPMNALDIEHVDLITKALRDEASSGTHVVISSHLIGNLESLCDAAILLNHKNAQVIHPEGGEEKWISNAYKNVYGSDS